MDGASKTLSNLTQAAQDIASSNTSESALSSVNDTEGWLVGPNGEFDGDPEEPRFEALLFYCILVRSTLSAQTAVFLPYSLSKLVLPGSHAWGTERALLLEKAA